MTTSNSKPVSGADTRSPSDVAEPRLESGWAVTRDGFQIELGKVEKHLLIGEINPEGELTLQLDGVDAARTLKFWKESGREIYDGDAGVQERLPVRIERARGLLPGSKSKIRVMLNGRLSTVFRLRPKRTAHRVVFRNVLPCLLLLVAVYYIFIYPSEVASFYAGIFQRQHPSPQKSSLVPHVVPAQPEKARQVV